MFVEGAEKVLGNTGALRNAAKRLYRGEYGAGGLVPPVGTPGRHAVSRYTYECRLAPGNLQSGRCSTTAFLLTADKLEEQATARMKRQQMLADRPHVPFSFIVEESAFRRRLGRREVIPGYSTGVAS